MSVEHIIDRAIEEGKRFDVIEIDMGDGPLLERILVENWDPNQCKDVEYWYETMKPTLCSTSGDMEFYRLSCSEYVNFTMKYKNLVYKYEGTYVYLVITDDLVRSTNYKWYIKCKDQPKPSILRRTVYKWDPTYNRWVDSSKYTSADISNFNGIDEAYHNIINDTDFLTSKSDILDKLGLSPSINYLLSSAPGMGKTSLIKCIASALNVDIYVIDHTAITSSDPGSIFGTTYTKENKINVYIFEDFDRYLKSSKSEQMASLLNALDGVEKMPPSLRFFTTNSKIVGEEFKAFYTRMRRVIHFDHHSKVAYSRSIRIVLGETKQENDIIRTLRDNNISMREANQLLVSSLLASDPLEYIQHNIILRNNNSAK